MKNTFTCLCIALLWGCMFAVEAQTDEERQKIVQSYANSNTRISVLQQQAQRKFEQDEKKVQEFLAKNTQLRRSFVKNGSLYYLKFIDAKGNPVYINTKNKASGELIKANQLYSGGSIGDNITGTNMVAGVWDGGQVRATHELLSGKVAMQPGQTMDGSGDNYKGNNHQTHVSGTMVGKDIPNQPSARGIAYGATAKNYDWDNDYTEMTAFAGQGYLISNHSYGYTNGEGDPIWRFGAYDASSVALDVVVKNAPNYLPFIAVGNEQDPNATDDQNKHMNGNWLKGGFDMVTGTSASKNVVTVGAVNGDKTMSTYSNWGPTDDGRVKPDVVAKGTGINSSLFAIEGTNTPSDNAYSGNGDESSGTSYATPAVAASGLLLQQYYNKLNNAYMKASTLKALLLGTAEDLGLTGPDSKFGWGLVNIEKAANAIKYRSSSVNPTSQTHADATSKGAYIEEITVNPTNNSTAELYRTVKASGCEPLIVSIAWTDDEGVEQMEEDGVDNTASRMIYDFDMLVKNMGTNAETRTWKPVTMANRTQAATISTTWFDGNGNNYKQVKIATPTPNQEYRIAIRKKTSSPAAARLISMVVTGTMMAAPAGNTNQTLANGSTIANIVVTGSDIKWYDAAAGGNLLNSSAELMDGTTYYASQMINGCESARLAITITLEGETSPCPPTLTLVNPANNVASGVVNLKASNSIEASHIISGTAKVALKAGNRIELKPSTNGGGTTFEVANGAVFQATIGGCEN
ncbi:S8 family serine peptidase [Emticicia sp. BO119]|uniref:S8 family serine peptidase n=1 Tax=Emticicia sp. BO119 TaxID=2757768 RepID=UPI0015F0B18B|nr:S8 family serine peptidase [Emticicia sp. BO119]MBA4851865.1 S8 family serine peptidase [Emticicia sp. BO119]